MSEHKKEFEDEMHYLLDAACDYGSTGLSTDFDLGEAIDRAYSAATKLQDDTITSLEKQLAECRAVIAAKDEALQNIADDCADDAPPFRSIGASGPVKEVARTALALKPGDVELVEVADNDCGSIKWTNEKWPHICKLYALKQKEGEITS
ncbi:hypothetical protein ACFQ2T_05105 [Methylophilus flavus]|uniref:Ead/Ea22-like family protein n=1 Tax=Methylophilus flavus TaxID=640084 RepID=A0ABW3PAA9_9PROT